MSDTMQLPTAMMRAKAQNILSDNTNLTDIVQTHIQQMQQQHDSLPVSMQAPFRDFVSTMQQHLSNGVDLHQHIGKLLTQAASVSEGTENVITQAYNPTTA